MKINPTYIFLIILLTSCKSSLLDSESLSVLDSEPLIGTIGIYENGVLSGNFTEVGVPNLQEKIRLSIQKEEFSKSSLRKFNRQIGVDENKLEIIDSINVKPHYYIFNLSDKVGFIRELNGSTNNHLRSYLENYGENQIITSVGIYFPPKVSSLLDEASEVYLVNDKKSSYSLQLLNKDKSKTSIEFNEGTPFGFSFSSFCWSADKRYRPVIVAFRERNKSCLGNTKKDPRKVKSQDILDKI